MNRRRSSRTGASSQNAHRTAETGIVAPSPPPLPSPAAATVARGDGTPEIGEDRALAGDPDRPAKQPSTALGEGPWVLRLKMPLAEIQLAENILSGLAWHPKFGLLLGIGESDAEVALARR